MICVPIMAKDTEEALGKIFRANSVADMLELRLDVMESFHLEDLLLAASKPVIATYRSQEQGGRGSADDETRARYLLNAIEKGADFLDVEYGMPQEYRRSILESAPIGKVIVSTHSSDGTPTCDKLKDTLRRLADTGAHIVKIVTRARKAEDNLRVLGLIPAAHTLGIEIITFCMGPIGRISRIASPLLGGYLTFACLQEGEESADGQIPVMDMKKVMKILKL